MKSSKDFVLAEIENQVFGLLHMGDLKELEKLQAEATAHLEAAAAAGILTEQEAKGYTAEIEKAAKFSRIKMEGEQ